ncbi:MAG TPA: isochorismatase family protein [Phycisphaerae bacterium]|nr:isochorismatase family protein [Phycisphaerae bacterium]HNU45549.1 isochorismatase family protein [Phycisphaerae bacterium]
MLRPDKLEIDRAMVLEIDLQDKLLPFIRHRQDVLAQSRKLIDGAKVFGLPVLATEQYPHGLGTTDAGIRAGLDAAGATIMSKMTFSSLAEPAVRKAVDGLDRPQVIVLGIETHVCVQQTVLDLRVLDYQVYVCADAVGSRAKIDYRQALRRMQQAGAFITTVESVLFELCHRCDTPQFKALLPVVKATPPSGME